MRTTIEITDQQHARLVQLAAEKGEKGFSRIVQEALARYLDEMDPARRRAVEEARAALGSLTPEESVSLEAATREIRKRWR